MKRKQLKAIVAGMVLCAGADDAEVTRRAAAIGREPAELRANGIAGTPSEVTDTLGALAELGVSRVYLQVLDLHDLDHLDLVAREVMPRLRCRLPRQRGVVPERARYTRRPGARGLRRCGPRAPR